MRTPPTSTSITATETSAITRLERRRLRAHPTLPRAPESRRESAMPRDATRSAGVRPKRIPFTIAMAMANPSTAPSARVSASLGMETGASAGSCFHATAVKTNPANPPATSRTQLSVTSWRTIRLGPPPRARRTLISQCRASDRASRRFATLA